MLATTDKHIILGSGSPRRKELLAMLGFEFEVIVKEVEETYPAKMNPTQVPVFLAQKKALAFKLEHASDLLITADTVVICEHEVLGKPENEAHALEILSKLAGKMHTVVTGVNLHSLEKSHSFSDRTEVYFSALTDDEIIYYIRKFQPFDKAGAYGIQDWIGLRAISRINGSYTNVVGLPTEKLYQEIQPYL